MTYSIYLEYDAATRKYLQCGGYSLTRSAESHRLFTDQRGSKWIASHERIYRLLQDQELVYADEVGFITCDWKGDLPKYKVYTEFNYFTMDSFIYDSLYIFYDTVGINPTVIWTDNGNIHIHVCRYKMAHMQSLKSIVGTLDHACVIKHDLILGINGKLYIVEVSKRANIALIPCSDRVQD